MRHRFCLGCVDRAGLGPAAWGRGPITSARGRRPNLNDARSVLNGCPRGALRACFEKLPPERRKADRRAAAEYESLKLPEQRERPESSSSGFRQLRRNGSRRCAGSSSGSPNCRDRRRAVRRGVWECRSGAGSPPDPHGAPFGSGTATARRTKVDSGTGRSRHLPLSARGISLEVNSPHGGHPPEGCGMCRLSRQQITQSQYLLTVPEVRSDSPRTRPNFGITPVCCRSSI